jgi:hypothetical protein
MKKCQTLLSSRDKVEDSLCTTAPSQCFFPPFAAKSDDKSKLQGHDCTSDIAVGSFYNHIEGVIRDLLRTFLGRGGGGEMSMENRLKSFPKKCWRDRIESTSDGLAIGMIEVAKELTQFE